MPSTTVPATLRSDKALARQIVEFDDRIDTCEAFIEAMTTVGAKGAVQKDVATLRKRMKTALEQTDKAAVAKVVATLVRDATKAADAACAAAAREIQVRCQTLWAKARGLLAQALVEVGALEPQALRLPLQKEQAALRAELDRHEAQTNKGLTTVAALEALIPKVEVLLKRVAAVAAVAQWMRTAYLPTLARTQAAIKRVPAERCRKTLLAELDFIEADTHKALLKADAKAVQARSLPQLQRIEKLAAQVVAVSPSVDRELARLAKIAGTGGASQAPAAHTLKAMIQSKASTWPAGADPDGIEASMATFEADLAKLAAQMERTQRAAVKA